MDLFDTVTSFFTSAYFRLFTRLLVLFFIILLFSLTYWTYRDAKKRGTIPVYWAIVVFLFNIFGWLIYLIVRPPEYEDDARERDLEIKTKEAMLNRSMGVCPSCHNPIEADFLICPYCMKKLKKACRECNKPLDNIWTVCPYCKANQ